MCLRSRFALPVFILLLCAVLSFPGFAGDRPGTESRTGASVEHSAAHRVTFTGIPNFGEITPTLYRGAQPSQQGLEKLADMNVAIVVDLRASRNQAEASSVEKLGMQYVSIPSHCPFPRDRNFVQLLQVIRGNPGKKVFVHCRLGTDRTGMAIAAYRMAEENWTAEEAMHEMQAFGFNSFHRAICPGLAEYEHSFPERLKHEASFETLRSPVANSASR